MTTNHFGLDLLIMGLLMAFDGLVRILTLGLIRSRVGLDYQQWRLRQLLRRITPDSSSKE